MGKSLIIGGGFSALVLQILNPESALVTPLTPSFLLNNRLFSRRKSVELNKMIATQAQSIGVSRFSKGFGLHDRLVLGGNSTVWGGFINIAMLPSWVIKKMESTGIRFVDLNAGVSSYVAPEKYKQMQTCDNKILNASKLIRVDFDAYLHNIRKVGSDLELNFFCPDQKNGWKLSSLRCSNDKKIYVAIGVVQLIDLMISSGILKEHDEIKLDEYQMNWHAHHYSKNDKFPTTSSILYKPSAIISHFLGLQKDLKKISLFDLVGMGLRQEFSLNKRSATYKRIDGVVKPTNSHRDFGSSIHYFNMRVNGKPVSKIFSDISPNLILVGMASSIQKEPGPISNNIIQSAILASD